MKIAIFILLFAAVALQAGSDELKSQIERLVDKGEFRAAQTLMRQGIAGRPRLDPLQRLWLKFEIERLDRIRKDFTKSRTEVVQEIKRFLPKVTESDLLRWEAEKSLEYMVIDGEKKYFQWAVNNLFRINSRLKAIKTEKQPPSPATGYDRLADLDAIVRSTASTDQKWVHPVRPTITYTLTVPANTIPAGEILRCWLPFPKEVPPRQTDIDLIETHPKTYILSDSQEPVHRSIYFEQITKAGKETVFRVSFSFTSHATRTSIDADNVSPVESTPKLEPYLQERPPHIVFTPELRRLSQEIVGDEKNPYRIAQKLFQWIDDHIPWASAREYSTFENISDYVYRNRHADCGMQTIFFITLCRLNGIPARWQSGWYFEPGDWTMHDWGEIYFYPYGWVPMDVTYGLQNAKRPEVKWFYLSGMDAYRWIVNSDYSEKFYPAKIHERSETIDFQRGEVEWRGGNLYFDQWEYEFKVELEP
ncbi:transglutaminase domain-containing protein [candidate division KSB1 bacterium]|nr:transglutaminase domain-containing protein [candidate division KSB1 bacterium]